MVHYTALIHFICCGLCCLGYSVGDFDEHYDVVFPRRVSHKGDFITHYIPTSYRRLHHHEPKKKYPFEPIHYVLPYRGENHHLELRPNSRFVSPELVVERFKKNTKDSRFSRLNETQCHYTGFIRGDKDSKVAVSTCDGLTGYIRTKRQYYFIEPAEGRRAAHPLYANKAHPHYVRATTPENGSKCETWDDVAKIMAKGRADRVERGGAENKCITELHVETLVVLDHTMLTYHKEIDLENYLLTVFNMAYDLFHDASLGTNVDLTIVRIIRLEEEDHEMNMNINKDAEKTLDYFREWQNKVNPKEDTHPNHHDVAVLITRVDICGSDSTCGLLGASKIGGMCDPQNQAAVCEDAGLRLGFVIAHEIAHTLAILHDTPQESGCNGTLPNNLTTVMDPSIGIKSAGWSKCSNKFLQLFVESGFGKCLYDPPTEHSFKPVDILPGIMYDGDFQCREMMGPNSALCMTGVDCENLICYLEDKGCVETHKAVAAGTKCGDKKWCFHGSCIQTGEREGAIDGGWSSWSEWSECSRTCGSGVAWQERHCDSPPPANGGRYCFGERKRHKICSTEPCDANLPTFRDVQCSEFNSWVYPEDGKVHNWKNYPMHDENPCVLFCINDWGDIASLRPRVIDGTSCQRGMRDICIDGLCKEIPCDLDLESNAVEDVCGVCKGDSTTCDVMKGEITVPCCGHIKEENVLVIPKDASNIKVEEMMPTESRIQIRSGNGETVYIVGNIIGSFNVPGTYAWVGNIRTKQEAIAIPGPLTEDISLWLVVTENVTISYTYGVPAKRQRKPSFYWDYLGWTSCSSACGPGVQESVPSCVEKLGGFVDDMYCKDVPKPRIQIRACEDSPCVNRWFVGDWGPCKTCPKGRRYRIVKCIRPTGEGEGEVVFISDSNCVGPKPKSSESCSCATQCREHGRTPRSHHYRKRSVPIPKTSSFKIFSNGYKVTGNISKFSNCNIEHQENISEHHQNPDGSSGGTLIPTLLPSGTTVSSLILASLTTQGPETELSMNPSVSHPLDHNSSMITSSPHSHSGRTDGTISLPSCDPNAEYDDNDDDDDYDTTKDLSNATTVNATDTPTHNYETTCIVLNTTRPVSTSISSDHSELANATEISVTVSDMRNTTPILIPKVTNEKAAICQKIADLMGKTFVDKDNITNLFLTIHTELEKGRRPSGLPAFDKEENPSGKLCFNIRGKEAMKFMNEMQKDFDNNKTKIRRK